MLGLLNAVGGAVLVSEKIRERFDDDSIIEAMNGICAEDDGERHDIPVDETADEAEFN